MSSVTIQEQVRAVTQALSEEDPQVAALAKAIQQKLASTSEQSTKIQGLMQQMLRNTSKSAEDNGALRERFATLRAAKGAAQGKVDALNAAIAQKDQEAQDLRRDTAKEEERWGKIYAQYFGEDWPLPAGQWPPDQAVLQAAVASGIIPPDMGRLL